MKIREAICCGRFYPDSKIELKNLIETLSSKEKDKINFQLAQNNIIGAIVPHAGYVYSGTQVIHPFEIISKTATPFDTVVIINPNHTGMGSSIANLSDFDYWETPLGKIEINRNFMDALKISYNNKAHTREHSGEVILPFIKHYFSDQVKVVLITMNHQTPETAFTLASKIHKAQNILKNKILLVASSDFCHFESPAIGYAKDQYLIDEILKLNTQNIFENVNKFEISACGYGPIMTLIEYSKLVSTIPQVELLKRGHSGEIHPSDKVVDYASFLCFE